MKDMSRRHYFEFVNEAAEEFEKIKSEGANVDGDPVDNAHEWLDERVEYSSEFIYHDDKVMVYTRNQNAFPDQFGVDDLEFDSWHKVVSRFAFCAIKQDVLDKVNKQSGQDSMTALGAYAKENSDD